MINLEHAGLEVHKHVVLTELCITKSRDLDIKPSEVKELMGQIKSLLNK